MGKQFERMLLVKQLEGNFVEVKKKFSFMFSLLQLTLKIFESLNCVESNHNRSGKSVLICIHSLSFLHHHEEFG
jgi:hypothetical protein